MTSINIYLRKTSCVFSHVFLFVCTTQANDAASVEQLMLDFHNFYLRGTDYREPVIYHTPPYVYWAWSKLGIAIGSDVALIISKRPSKHPVATLLWWW